MKISLYCLLLFSLFFMAFTCGEDESPYSCNKTLEFEINLTTFPLSDTFHLEDTIWLFLEIPNQLTEIATGELVDVGNYDFRTRYGTNRKDVVGSPRAFSSFEFIAIKGVFDIFNINSGGAYAAIITEKGKDSQRFHLGIVPKEIGLFQVSFATLTADMMCEEIFFSGKEKNNLKLYYRMNGGDNAINNYHLIVGSQAPISTPEQFKEGAAFAFVVVD